MKKVLSYDSSWQTTRMSYSNVMLVHCMNWGYDLIIEVMRVLSEVTRGSAVCSKHLLLGKTVATASMTGSRGVDMPLANRLPNTPNRVELPVVLGPMQPWASLQPTEVIQPWVSPFPMSSVACHTSTMNACISSGLPSLLLTSSALIVQSSPEWVRSHFV